MSDNRLLVITSDNSTFLEIQKIAEDHAFHVLCAVTLEEIQNYFTTFKPSLIILDLHFAELDGISLLNYLTHIECKSQLIMIGVEDEKLLLAIQHISKVKGLKLQKILKSPLQAHELSEALKSIEQIKSSAIDAHQIVHALEENYFVIQYQPLIDLQTMGVCGFEALIRLKLPNGNIILPLDFISTSEETGLIVPITAWLIKSTFEQYHIFQKKGPNIKLSINLSSICLNDPVFPDEVLKTANIYKVDPKNICFEITESGISHQSELILEVLTRLRVMGFELSIDDFGTGYSSIVELQRLPFTQLKIDRRFVSDIIENPAALIIVRAIIDLGHNLGLQLVAEGVENQQTLTILQQLKCDIVQGFLIAKPIFLENLEEWFNIFTNQQLIWKGHE